MWNQTLRPVLAVLLAVAVSLSVQTLRAEVRLPKIFGSNMVLQRGGEIPVWGQADAGEEVSVSIGDAAAKATADGDGRWAVELPAMEAGGPHTVTVQCGDENVVLENVLIGEVWVCSGQSNMAWSVDQSDDADLHKLTANLPNIRLISVPNVGTQEPQNDFGGDGWQVCSAETVGSFSGVGYFFGRQLHQTLNVPIGLIDNAWGGSACEAWVRRDVLAADERYSELLARWAETEATYDHDEALARFEQSRTNWQKQVADAKAAGRPAPTAPRAPRNPLTGQHRPGNLYNGCLKPFVGYGIRGAIWYQGESNAGRAYQYRSLFPLMIQHWRNEWNQGDFPFYFVQLADYMDESAQPQDSAWAELREAQTMTLAVLPNTGQAVITDLGESHDIHPRDKANVALRLARWALARDYGVNVVYRSPQYASHQIQGNKVVITFDHTGGGLDTFDVRDVVGFTIAGADKVFVNAQARIVDRTTIEVWSDDVTEPAAARYAWANNPVCNLQNTEGLPVTPFRTDDWPGVTADVHK